MPDIPSVPDCCLMSGESTVRRRRRLLPIGLTAVLRGDELLLSVVRDVLCG
jgi:hypothetical protein